jgi:FixJ family two-component response regulator
MMEGPLPGFVHIVDDDPSFRTAIERRLKRTGYEVATYVSAQHLLEQLPSESVPSCILLDVQIPGLDGLALQSRLSELGSTLPIIFLTGHPDIRTTVRAIRAGADDFLIKPVSSDRLLQAIELAIVRHEARRGLKSWLDMVCARVSALTPREREVFERVVRGDTNKHAARSLGCTERTIKAHRHRVMKKMQVQTLAELVSLAERVGVLGGASVSRAQPVDAPASHVDFRRGDQEQGRRLTGSSSVDSPEPCSILRTAASPPAGPWFVSI